MPREETDKKICALTRPMHAGSVLQRSYVGACPEDVSLERSSDALIKHSRCFQHPVASP